MAHSYAVTIIRVYLPTKYPILHTWRRFLQDSLQIISYGSPRNDINIRNNLLELVHPKLHLRLRIMHEFSALQIITLNIPVLDTSHTLQNRVCSSILTTPPELILLGILSIGTEYLDLILVLDVKLEPWLQCVSHRSLFSEVLNACL